MIETVSRDAGSQSRGRAQALRQAQLTMMSNPDHAHPLFWAPFDLVGDSR
jgi:CHAT domain-containing protein